MSGLCSQFDLVQLRRRRLGSSRSVHRQLGVELRHPVGIGARPVVQIESTGWRDDERFDASIGDEGREGLGDSTTGRIGVAEYDEPSADVVGMVHEPGGNGFVRGLSTE